MKKIKFLGRWVGVLALSTCLAGCATTPKGFLKPTEESLKKRSIQMRQYDTKDETMIISAVAGVLQDLGFTLDEAESGLGVVAASKKADAVDGGQVAMAMTADVLCALAGGYPNSTARCDAVQNVKASVVVKPSLEGGKTVVRVTFQRVVWNMSNQINRVETIEEPEIYQKFFDDLSKSVFLEGHKI